MHVLEFGCGTGSTAIIHAPYVRKYDATDSSENMIRIGRDKAVDAGVTNITFTCCELGDFVAQPGSIDLVLGLNVLHLIADRAKALGIVHRLLKPGGMLVSSTACIGGSPMRLIKLIAPLGKRLGLMPDVYVFTPDDLQAEITASGFAVDNQWSHGSSVKTSFVIARRL